MFFTGRRSISTRSCVAKAAYHPLAPNSKSAAQSGKVRPSLVKRSMRQATTLCSSVGATHRALRVSQLQPPRSAAFPKYHRESSQSLASLTCAFDQLGSSEPSWSSLNSNARCLNDGLCHLVHQGIVGRTVLGLELGPMLAVVLAPLRGSRLLDFFGGVG